MAARRSSNFRVQFDDDPDVAYRSERDDYRIEKLSQRMTLFFVLFPCLIGIIFLVAYFDVKSRVSQTSSSGAYGFEKLSKDLESRFSSLSLKQAKLEEALAQKTTDLEKYSAALKAGLEQVKSGFKTELNQLQTTNKSDIQQIQKQIQKQIQQFQQFQGAVAKNEKSLAPLLDGLNTISSDIEILDKRVTQELADIGGATAKAKNELGKLKNELGKLKTGVVSLSSDKIGAKKLALALKREKIGYDTQLALIAKKIQKQIESLEDSIGSLRKKTAVLEKIKKAPPVKKASKPKKSPISPPKPPKKQPAAKSAPKTIPKPSPPKVTPPVKKPAPPPAKKAIPQPPPEPAPTSVPKPLPELGTPKPGKILEQELTD